VKNRYSSAQFEEKVDNSSRCFGKDPVAHSPVALTSAYDGKQPKTAAGKTSLQLYSV